MAVGDRTPAAGPAARSARRVTSRPAAFVLFTDLPKAGPYLAALAERDVKSLVVAGPPHWLLEHAAVSFIGVAGHPFERIEAHSFIAPENLPAILMQVRTWAEEYELVGMFASSESFVEPAGQVADLLGLPGVGLRASRVCRNKLLQRLHLPEWSPEYVLATTGSRDAVLAALSDRFPLLTKPLDMYCSIGVQVIPDGTALGKYLDQLEPTSSVLLEERVAGREYSVETIVAAGRPVFSSVTQKGTNEDVSDFFVEMAHTQPAGNLTDVEVDRLKDAQAAVLKRLDFGTGMAHGEYRIAEDGRVVLMEIAARPAGDGILQLCHLATGESIEAAVIDIALGRRVTYPEPSRRARQLYFEHQPGTLHGVYSRVPDGPPPVWVVEHGLWPKITPVDPDAPPGLRQLLVLKFRGDELPPIVDSFGRAVTAIFDGPTVATLDAFEAELRDAITIAVDV